MKTKQSLLILVATMATTITVHGQLNRPFASGVRTAAEKVLTAFPEQVNSIRGDTISYADNVAVFSSTVKPEGALESTLTQFKDADASNYAWKAVMLRTDDFDIASKKYSAYYQQLKNMVFHTNQQPVKMVGSYQATTDTKNFYSTVLQPKTDEAGLNKLRLEILLESDLTEWTVSVLVYDRDHEDWEGSMVR